MKPLKLFEEYIKESIVKRVKVDGGRAKNLVLEAGRRMISLKERLEKIEIRNENANDYVEYCYDLLMHLVRAKMLLEGYSASGTGAHEAEISYLRILGFEENDVQFANELRYFRNGILYYGTVLDKEYADKVIAFTKRIYLRLKAIANS